MEVLNIKKEPRERLHLRHDTSYTYSSPVSFSPHRLVLRPREGHDVRLESMALETFPASSIRWYRDILDNSIAIAEFSQKSTRLTIRSEFVIALPPAEEGEQPPLLVSYPPRISGMDELATMPYRQFTYPPEVDHLRRRFASLELVPSAGDRIPIFDDLNAFIHKTIRYNRREEHGVQSPVVTLDLASGSCRDMAVLMIETAREMGFPARFVSGYLETANSKVGRGSTHAWAEIYLPERGWTGYDPSIGRRVGPGHVAVGVSHHPRGVMPVTGEFTGYGAADGPLVVTISTKRLPPPLEK